MDGSLRRTEFLSREVEGWGHPGTTEVVRGRAEELARDDRFRQHFEVVAARSFGPPPVTAECGAPLLTVGGLLVVSEPPQDPGGRRWPTEGLELLGLAPLSQTRFDGRFSYQVLIKRTITPERYPRRVGNSDQTADLLNPILLTAPGSSGEDGGPRSPCGPS